MKERKDMDVVRQDKNGLEQRILDAVVDEFNEKGMKFTMDDIAARLRISKKTIYKVYDNKEQMLHAMVDEGFSAIKREEAAIYEDKEADTATKIEKIIIAMPDSLRTVDFRKLQQLKNGYPEIYEYVESRIESGWEKTISIIQQGMDEGVIRRVPVPVIKAMVESTIEEFMSRDILVNNDLGYDDALSAMADILMNGIKS